MEPKEIIYYNEYTGLTEVCSSKDINSCHQVGFDKDSIPAKDAAMKLYLDKELRFVLYDNAVNMQDFLMGKPRMSKGKKLYEAVFSIEDETETSIVARLDEVQGNDFMMLCGRIEWKIQPNIIVNDIKGNAIIRIFDVKHLSPTVQSKYLLGGIALGLGLYFFVDIDGRWAEIRNSGNFVDLANDVQTKQIKDAIAQDTKKLHERQISIMEGQSDIVQRVERGFESVNNNLNTISQKLDELSLSMKVYKSDVESMLKKAEDEDLEESIIEDFSNRLSTKIVDSINKRDNETNYERNASSLKKLFGDNWNKLNDKSKQFLVTANVLFDYMEGLNNSLDYSGVCILVTKAVEEEMKKRFYNEFLDYLYSILPNEIEKWHYCMRTENSRHRGQYIPIDQSKFTLGSVSHICCLYKPRFCDVESYESSKQQIVDFASKYLFVDSAAGDAREVLKSIARFINDIKDRYRNPAAHINVIQKVTAQQCLDEVIYIQKVLIQILAFMKK